MAVYSLLELNGYVRRVLALNFPDPIWIRAEVAQVDHRTHSYLELIQKAPDSEVLLAQSRAILWARQRSVIQRNLPSGIRLEQLLETGMEVRMLVKVVFEERYGYQLHIQEVDADLALGQLAKERQATLEKLLQEDLLNRNVALPLPAVLQRIAVFSSPQAAGLQDFLEQLRSNPYGFAFFPQVFPIAVQGKEVAADFQQQLQRLPQQGFPFDVAVLIRGGGSRIDLAAFDQYELCAAIAKMEIPLLTGIGHETDEVLADRVAHRALKTPTAVAEFLVYHNALFESRLLEIGQQIREWSQRLTNHTQDQLQTLERQLVFATQQQLFRQQKQLEQLEQQIVQQLQTTLLQASHQLDKLAGQVEQLQPAQAFKRGFCITETGGQVLQSVKGLKEGTPLITHLMDGLVHSLVEKTESHD